MLRRNIIKFVSNINFHPACHTVLLKKCKNQQVIGYVKKSTFIRKPAEKDDYKSYINGLFVAKLNMNWIFPYPVYEDEVHAKREIDFCNQIQTFLDENVDSASIDRKCAIDDTIIEGLKELQLYGLRIPRKYGGLGLNNAQYTHLMETISHDMSIFITLNAHSIASQAILMCGTEEQKLRYLPKLAIGKSVAAYCIAEPMCGNDYSAKSMSSQAYLDGDSWVLNGDKIWVTNGNTADVLIVFAKVSVPEADGKTLERVTAFIVDGDSEGVVRGAPVDCIGLRGTNFSSISFNNVRVPTENLLYEQGHGFAIAHRLMNQERYILTSCTGFLKKLLTDVTDHLTSRKQFGNKLSAQALVKDRIYQIAKQIYIMESMGYLIADHMDIAEKNNREFDYAAECAVAKVYSSEAIWNIVSSSMDLMGGLGVVQGLEYERLLRDAAMLKNYLGSNDVLHMYIALSGLDYASQRAKAKLHNDHRHPFGVIKDAWINLKDEMAPPNHIGLLHKKIPSFGATTKDNRTYHWLDPALQELGKNLETSLVKFERRVYGMCKKVGNELENEQQLLIRFSKAATNLFIMTTLMSRVNKSVVLGLRNYELEANLMACVFFDTFEENENIYKLLLDPPQHSFDGSLASIGEEVLEAHGYFFSHPLDCEPKFEEPKHYREQLKQILSE